VTTMNRQQEIRAKLGDFAADQDLMRDVYMTSSQRAAYERILARAIEQREGSAGSVKQNVPVAKRYPKPDENGNDTGPCCAHAYADGWNECRAAMLAAAQSSDNKEADRG